MRLRFTTKARCFNAGIGAFVFLFLLQQNTYAEDWGGKAVRVANQMARGNVSGAAQAALPSAGYQLPSKARIGVSGNGVSVRQPIPGVEQLNSRYANVNADYRAHATIGSNGLPRATQAVQTTAGNSYLRNTTALSLPGVSND